MAAFWDDRLSEIKRLAEADPRRLGDVPVDHEDARTRSLKVRACFVHQWALVITSEVGTSASVVCARCSPVPIS